MVAVVFVLVGVVLSVAVRSSFSPRGRSCLCPATRVVTAVLSMAVGSGQPLALSEYPVILRDRRPLARQLMFPGSQPYRAPSRLPHSFCLL